MTDIGQIEEAIEHDHWPFNLYVRIKIGIFTTKSPGFEEAVVCGRLVRIYMLMTFELKKNKINTFKDWFDFTITNTVHLIHTRYFISNHRCYT